MRDVPDYLKFHSENLEPAFCHMIGMWHAQAEWMKQTYGPRSVAYVDALQNWWWGMQSISKLLIACQGAIHATIAHNNLMQDVKRMIEKELNIQFCFTDGDTLNFRNLVSFEYTHTGEK